MDRFPYDAYLMEVSTPPARMKRSLFQNLLLIGLFTAGCFSLSAQAPPAADTSDLSTAFDFWIGDWEVTWLGPDSTIVTGSNRIESTLDGRVLQEHFRDPGRNFLGTSISVYNPRTRQWRQAWADNQGGYFDFMGWVGEDRRIFRTTTPNARGDLYRMVFHDIREDSLIWEWQRLPAGWDNWETVWKIDYRRKE